MKNALLLLFLVLAMNSFTQKTIETLQAVKFCADYDNVNSKCLEWR